MNQTQPMINQIQLNLRKAEILASFAVNQNLSAQTLNNLVEQVYKLLGIGG